MARKNEKKQHIKASSSEINKVNAFFLVAQADRPNEDTSAEDATGQQHPKSILPAPAKAKGFDISELERPFSSSSTDNMETQNESRKGTDVASETSDLFPQPSFNLFSNDPTCWPDLCQMPSDVTSSKEGLNKLTQIFP